MEATRLTCHYSSSATTTLLPKSPNKTNRLRCKRLIVKAAERPSSSSSSDSSPSWSSVDESMIVLRKRIHQMKVMEGNYEPPEEWAEWEKEHHARYGEYVCGFVGALQWVLMHSRPSFAIAMIAIVAMSVPVSAVAVALRLAEVASGALSSLHLG